MDLEALLGPLKKVARGAAAAGSIVVTPDAVSSVVVDASGVSRKQVSLTQFVRVTRESDEDKARRVEEKKRKAEKALQEQEAKRIDTLEAEVQGTRLFLEQLHEEEHRVHEQRKDEHVAQLVAWEESHILSPDGTEKPPVFEWDHARYAHTENPFIMDDAAGADEARARRLDTLIPVTEYYTQDAFPIDCMATFMTQCGRIPLDQCEIGVVIKGSWWRNRRFSDAEELRRFMTTMRPERLDLGPIHPKNVTNIKESHSRLALRRFLVFDVDMEDRGSKHPKGYIRNCGCKDTKSVCSNGCWFYMRTAVKTLTYLLRRCLGAKHILPVYSGRRGVHVWVVDDTFVEYTEDDRRGVVERMLLFGDPAKYYHDEYSAYVEEYILRPEFRDHFFNGKALICEPASAVCLMEHAAPATDEDRTKFVVAVVRLTEPGIDPARRLLEWENVCSVVDGMRREPQGTHTLAVTVRFKSLFSLVSKEVLLRYHRFF